MAAAPTPIEDLSRLCVHTMTTKPWSLEEAIEHYQRAGVAGITVWRDALEKLGVAGSAKALRESGLEVVSLCRGGFFPAASEADRQKAIEENRRAIAEAHAIGAPVVVLVCGAEPSVSLDESRKMIADGIAAVLGDAEAAGVKLAIEPLHPMYADTKSAVSTMKQANDLVDRLGSASVGVAVDVYHLWWDDTLEAEITRCGDSIFAFHVCDWRVPTRHMLTDRGLMGEGCIDIPRIRGCVEAAGFEGPIEVEIFSEEFWAMDQAAYLDRIIQAYRAAV